MQGLQLLTFVPHELHPPPVPHLPRPPGFFDQVNFANAGGIDVLGGQIELSGPMGSQVLGLPNVPAGHYHVETPNIAGHHFHYVEMEIHTST